MTPRIKNPQFLASLVLGLALFAPACGDDGQGHDDADSAHLMLITAPPAALVAGEPADVVWQVHTEGDLHHTEVRACMGHQSECGLGEASSFDENFQATMAGTDYTASLSLDVAGPWTIAVFAHVGETPHISEVTHAMVAAE